MADQHQSLLKILVVSTAHIRHSDDRALRAMIDIRTHESGAERHSWLEADISQALVTPMSRGWMLALLAGGQISPHWGLSIEFGMLLAHCRRLGCDYLRLDADGPVLEGMRTFAW